MIRVALAVVLLVAVAGVAFSAVDAGRHDRTAARLDAGVERVERAARLLVDRDDPTATGVPGARRVVSLRLPARSLANAGVARVALRGGDDEVRYRLDGGRARRHALPVDLRTPDGPVVLHTAGRHRLRLGLVGTPAGVRVARAGPGGEARVETG
ncbi:MAG: ABC transporter [Haloferacaceae archaeon]